MLKFNKNILANQGFEYTISEDRKIYFTGKEYWILHDSNRYLISKSQTVIDNTTSEEVGSFCFSNWTLFIGYKDKLVWQGEEFKFKKIKPDIRYSLFNKSTWGHFKFQLSKGNAIATYIFKIDSQVVGLGNPFVEKPFEGNINIQNLNPLIALAGFYLVEKAINNAGIESS